MKYQKRIPSDKVKVPTQYHIGGILMFKHLHESVGFTAGFGNKTSRK